MEKIYYILDTESNEILLDNASYEEAMSWLSDNGIASKHCVFEKKQFEQ